MRITHSFVTRLGHGSARRGRLQSARVDPSLTRIFTRSRRATLDFNIPPEIQAYLAELDEFIEREIKPLERENDNIRFFDHRREWARTDFDRGGLPRPEWEELLAEMRRRADLAGYYRYALPKEYGGKDG